ncbi:hypothetical protein A3D00_03945 [Candidatus Woesebacteria bacterium RIFCSPHIGHO2_02_FULL_38_9]|uniref:Phage holin family protein n=1 Tax=Candidatus Woesebacteria bacterium RIFCSPHIGHO2_01_FULL_39_28 TaxID=1802496 RepID=A0A1F7YIT2_9BACT|nr:MAG: hypothetical protein A2627_03260 [Candidatus Woesebacteria bacterium RIFCSPHIGHO2_01_FULL_39_28]OGM31818.1 MAG: hypothetical protein A3D00_03945 [Candidatus Woesebacteria bacterium RIFCSPHIGHO2_02_FULL_38_9]OGM56949.1 MAG: hypothetical protein A3A50_03605 [Candidatus Woesebacteria bacterium RIFCSPLOWO2_01_FULL_38_20]
MKKIIRIFVIETGTLIIVMQFTKGITIENGASGLITVGGALTLTALLVKPIINLLLLPLNLITFGLFRWVGQAIALFLVDFVLPSFTIKLFEFQGFKSDLFVIPPIFLRGVLAYVAFSFLLSTITTFFRWLIK